jgi:predicted PurR-regulated permease PerM
VRQVQNIVVDVAQFELQLEALLAEPITVLGTEIRVDDVVADLINSTASTFTIQTSNALDFLSTTSISFAWLLIILVCTFYFLLDAYKLQNWLVALSPPDTQADARRILAEVGRIWQGYVGGTLALIIITATAMSLVYTAIGLPGAVPIGLLTGLLVVIPELGPFLAGILATTIAFFLGSDFLPVSGTTFAIITAIIHLALMQLRASWLQPRLRERYVQIHGGIVFVSILGALILGGVLSALIVIPTIATLGVLGRYARAKLFGLDPWHV